MGRETDPALVSHWQEVNFAPRKKSSPVTLPGAETWLEEMGLIVFACITFLCSYIFGPVDAGAPRKADLCRMLGFFFTVRSLGCQKREALYGRLSHFLP